MLKYILPFIKLLSKSVFTILSFIGLVYAIASIIYNIYLIVRNIFLRIKDLNISVGFDIQKERIKNIMKTLDRLKRKRICIRIKKSLEITSWKKMKIVLYILAFSVLQTFQSINISYNSKCLNFILLVFSLFGLMAVLEYLSSNLFKSNLESRIDVYIIKFIVLIAYSLTSFSYFLKELDSISLLLFLVGITIIFSMGFLRSVIEGFEFLDSFKSMIFFVLNIIVIYLYNLGIIGLSFGFFYVNNNIAEQLFNGVNMNSEFNLENIISIIQGGLHYFFNFPEIKIDSLEKTIVFFEFILGDIFHIVIIGFFISYISSKTFQIFNFSQEQ